MRAELTWAQSPAQDPRKYGERLCTSLPAPGLGSACKGKSTSYGASPLTRFTEGGINPTLQIATHSGACEA